MDYLIIVFRTLFFYFLILFIYRLMGKREVGELGIIDLIVSILIAELVVISIENYKDSILCSVIPIVLLTVLQIVLAYSSLKFPNFRNFLDGNPSIIIEGGKINYKEMIKQKYNLDDLLVQIRDKGYRSIEEVEYAILENNGTLSIFKKDSKYQNNSLPLPLILDKKINNEALKHLNKDKSWVLNELSKRNIKLNNVFYAFYRNNNLYIIKDDELIK